MVGLVHASHARAGASPSPGRDGWEGITIRKTSAEIEFRVCGSKSGSTNKCKHKYLVYCANK